MRKLKQRQNKDRWKQLKQVYRFCSKYIYNFLDTLLEIDPKFGSVFQATEVERGGHSGVPECRMLL